MKVLITVLLLTFTPQAMAQTSRFFPGAPTALEANTVAENGVHGDGARQAHDMDADGPHVSGSQVQSLSLPRLAVAEGYGRAHAYARYGGEYTQNADGGTWLIGGTAEVHESASVTGPAGSYAYGGGESYGKVEQSITALGSGKYTGQLTFGVLGTGNWSIITGPSMSSWVQGSNMEWAYNPADDKWHASGALYTAAIHPTTGARIHAVQWVNDSTFPPISGLHGFPSYRAYDVSGWLVAGQTLTFGQTSDTGLAFDFEYGSGGSRSLVLDCQAVVPDLINDSP